MPKKLLTLLFILWQTTAHAANLPNHFVYLENIDASILQDLRYASDYNFVGRPIQGYATHECILTQPAALALHRVQTELKPLGFSLKVYDCYRPQMAVNDFIAWSKLPEQQSMKTEFYPRVEKSAVFKLGYISGKSGHSRGSTVDLTIVALPAQQQPPYHPGQPLVACFASYNTRYRDNSIDMGTGFDCFDPLAHSNSRAVNAVAMQNRQWLRMLMQKQHFKSYPQEWWHFTLKNEPFPHTYFNFPVG